MSETEKMEGYISRTKFISDKYDMMRPQLEALIHLATYKPYDAISLSFKYGRAKGYRAAKREVR